MDTITIRLTERSGDNERSIEFAADVPQRAVLATRAAQPAPVGVTASPLPCGMRLSADGLTVVDPARGLEWARESIGGEHDSWQAANDAARGCAIRGHTDWRLPTIQELLTLVDYERKEPAIDTALFPDTRSDRYWTSTPWAGSPAGYAWSVDFSGGYADCLHRDNDGFCRAVRSVPVAGQ